MLEPPGKDSIEHYMSTYAPVVCLFWVLSNKEANLCHMFKGWGQGAKRGRVLPAVSQLSVVLAGVDLQVGQKHARHLGAFCGAF